VETASRSPADVRSGQLRLGPRLFVAMALVVISGAGTLLIVSVLVAPAAFMTHLRRSGMSDLTPAVTDHVNQAFMSATLISLGIGTLVAVLVAGLVTWLVARRLAAPVVDLAAATGRIADGVYDTPVADPRLGPEFAALAASVNQLSTRLSTSNQTRRRLLADLGHQLRTPIASLRATVEAVADGVLPADEATIGTLVGQVSQLDRLVTDLESVSRAEERQLALDPRPVSLTVLVRRAAAAVLARYRAGEVDLVLAADETDPVVVADADRIVEALLDVLDNALQHTPAGGRVDVRVEAVRPRASSTRDPDSRGRARVVVADTGEGFDPDTSALLFERFYRGARDGSPAAADGSRAGRHGSGIGLTIAHAIVDAHHGTIEAHSDGPGRGATFTITLPSGG
jgi:two-component system, OmpR family, sensor histidine kinase BaeS